MFVVTEPNGTLFNIVMEYAILPYEATLLLKTTKSPILTKISAGMSEQQAAEGAARDNWLEGLSIIRRERPALDFCQIMAAAVEGGHISAMVWCSSQIGLRTRGRDPYFPGVIMAARRGDLATVAWATKAGDAHARNANEQDILEAAASNGHLEIITWWDAIYGGIERHLDDIARIGAKFNHPHIVIWCYTQQKNCIVSSLVDAAQRGDLGFLEWASIEFDLKAAVTDGDLEEIMDSVFDTDRVDILSWAMQYAKETLNLKNMLQCAIESNARNMAAFLRTQLAWEPSICSTPPTEVS